MPLTIQQALGQAMELGRSGKAEAAALLLRKVLETAPDQPDALQLLGMVARSRGANDEAIEYFRRSLRVNPRQANVLNNLGNALLALGRRDEAVESYRKALRLNPAFADALLNLGLAQLELEDWSGAEQSLRASLRIHPQNRKAMGALGRALREAGRLDRSIAVLEEAVALGPGDVSIVHGLAMSYRAAGNPTKAVTLLQEVLAREPVLAESHYLLGHCWQDLGKFDEASSAYEEAIRVRAEDRDFHQSLNSLYWQTERLDRFLVSYREALKALPRDAGLRADLARWLVLSGNLLEAVTLVHEGLAIGVDDAELRHRLGQALWSSGRPVEALAQFERARVMAPVNVMIARENARALIILERHDEADAILQPLLLRDPDDQQSLAYLGTCWRLTNDTRGAWLHDYERFVKTQMLSPPAEHGSIKEFNSRLTAKLEALHRGTQHPLDQTLRGGTQTLGDLFDDGGPEIAIIKGMIEAAVRTYIDSLPDDPGHPFLRRKSGHFRFSGSWSVRLRSGGFHENHVHPEGWISSCYYVSVPASVRRKGGHEGWLKIGESALHLGSREAQPLLIRPEVGMLVLFPSYFYHGTVPFAGEDVRTTIAFDVVPA